MRQRLVAIVVLMMLVSVACGDDDAATTTTAVTTTAATTTVATTTTIAVTTTTTVAETTTPTLPLSSAIVGFWVRQTDDHGAEAIYFGADGEFLYIPGPVRTRSNCATGPSCDPGTYTLDGDTMSLTSQFCGDSVARMTVQVFTSGVRAITFTVIEEPCGDDIRATVLAEALFTYEGPRPPE